MTGQSPKKLQLRNAPVFKPLALASALGLSVGCGVAVPEQPSLHEHEVAEVSSALEAPRDDIVFRNTVSGDNAMWMLNGTTVQSTSLIQAAADQNWKMRTTGDFNRDGVTDLLWHNTSTGELRVWMMNGTALLQQLHLAVVDANWVPRGTGDFNGDGHTDIFWHDQTGGNTSIWLMNGTSLVSSGLPPVVSDLRWKVAGVGDMNNDGKADVLWRHDTGPMTTWLMNGATYIGGQNVLPSVTDLDWQPVGTGEFNGDQQTDLLWRHVVSRQLMVWVLNAGSYVNSSVISSTPGSDWLPIGTGRFGRVCASGSETVSHPMNAGPLRYSAPVGCKITGMTSAVSGAKWSRWSSEGGGTYWQSCNDLSGGISTCTTPMSGLNATADAIFCDYDSPYSDNRGDCSYTVTLAPK